MSGTTMRNKHSWRFGPIRFGPGRQSGSKVGEFFASQRVYIMGGA